MTGSLCCSLKALRSCGLNTVCVANEGSVIIWAVNFPVPPSSTIRVALSWPKEKCVLKIDKMNKTIRGLKCFFIFWLVLRFILSSIKIGNIFYLLQEENNINNHAGRCIVGVIGGVAGNILLNS